MDLGEKVAQFVSVTGCSEDVAKKYLEACAGDIDTAIGMHLEDQAAVTQDSRPAASEAQATEDLLSPSTYEEIHGVRAPIPQMTGVLIEDELPPTRKIFRTRKLPQTVFDPFQDYSAVGTRVAHTSKHGSAEKRQNLAEIFRPPHDLLFNGTFHEAKLAGEQKMRWLLVNLQDSKEFASQIMNRDMWSNFHVKELIKANFIFMQVYRITDEGVQFRNLYHVESYPSIVVIDPRTGEKMISWGIPSVDAFLHEAMEFLANNPYEEECQKDQQHVRTIINLSEESQLEAAIAASLEESKASNSPLVFSDDSDTDCIPLSPYNGPLCSQGFNGAASSSLPAKDGRTGPQLDLTRGRKRHPNDDEIGSTRKRMRTDIDPVCKAIDSIELTCSNSEVAVNEGSTPNSHLVLSSKGKGKGKRKLRTSQMTVEQVISGGSSAAEAECTVEELLASGDINKKDISHILFRLPDGSRLQKSFLCERPLQELFSFLEDRSIKVAEHEIETHFPKRSLLVLDRSTSFKHNCLYPRETVFVNTL